MNRLLILAVLVTFTGATTAQQPAPNPVKRVLPRGADGDSYFYTVTCKNKYVTSIVYKDSTNAMCVRPQGQPKRCVVDWALEDAARAACGG